MVRVLSCRAVWVKERCERGHVVVRPRLCRDRLVCPICAEKYAADRVKKALNSFKLLTTKRGAKLYLIHIVFTFPENLWSKIFENPDLAYKTVYKALGGLEKEDPIWFLGGLIGGVARLHLWSSRNVFMLYPHVHVVIPNRILKKNGKMMWFVRIRPWFTHNNLRFRWKLALEKVFNCEVKGDVDIHVDYVDVERNIGKAIHVLRYVFRQFVYDVFRKGLDSDKRLNDGDARCFTHGVLEVESKYHLVRWFGFLASNGRKWIYETRKVEEMDEALDSGEFDDEESRCVICKAKIVESDKVLWSDIFKSGDG